MFLRVRSFKNVPESVPSVSFLSTGIMEVLTTWELRCLSTQVCDTETCGVVLTDTNNKTSHYTLVVFCSHVPRIPLRSPLASPILILTDQTLVLVLLLFSYRKKPCHHTLKVPPEGCFLRKCQTFVRFHNSNSGWLQKHKRTNI